MLIVISGTSGAGKSSIINELLHRRHDLALATSATTRQRRAAEKNGREYCFLSEKEFQRKAEQGAFLETALVHGHLYGTLKSEIERIGKEGKKVLLDIDVQGAASVRKIHASCLTIFIEPPSAQEVRRRLVERATEPADERERRLADADAELAEKDNFDHVVCNDNLAQTVDEVDKIITERLKGKV